LIIVKPAALYNTRILLLILIATIGAYLTHLFLKRTIDPRRSVASFLIYILAHFAIVLIWVFLFSLVLNQYKDFFFKR